jgi:hypothetical protein
MSYTGWTCDALLDPFTVQSTVNWRPWFPMFGQLETSMMRKEVEIKDYKEIKIIADKFNNRQQVKYIIEWLKVQKLYLSLLGLISSILYLSRVGSLTYDYTTSAWC